MSNSVSRKIAVERFMHAAESVHGLLTIEVLRKELHRMTEELEIVDAIVDALHEKLDQLTNS